MNEYIGEHVIIQMELAAYLGFRNCFEERIEFRIKWVYKITKLDGGESFGSSSLLKNRKYLHATVADQ